MLSHVAQTYPGRRHVTYEFIGGAGEEDLASMPGGEQACHPVQQWTNVVSISLLDHAGMEGHAHSYLAGLCGPGLGVESALGIEGSLDRLGSGREGSLEGV